VSIDSAKIVILAEIGQGGPPKGGPYE
jgi:hypothetical protein